MRQVITNQRRCGFLKPVLFIAFSIKFGQATRAKCNLFHPVVKKRRVRLDADSYAHSVGLDQIVAAEQQLHVKVQRRIAEVKVLSLVQPRFSSLIKVVDAINLLVYERLVQRTSGM